MNRILAQYKANVCNVQAQIHISSPIPHILGWGDAQDGLGECGSCLDSGKHFYSTKETWGTQLMPSDTRLDAIWRHCKGKIDGAHVTDQFACSADCNTAVRPVPIMPCDGRGY